MIALLSRYRYDYSKYYLSIRYWLCVQSFITEYDNGIYDNRFDLYADREMLSRLIGPDLNFCLTCNTRYVFFVPLNNTYDSIQLIFLCLLNWFVGTCCLSHNSFQKCVSLASKVIIMRRRVVCIYKKIRKGSSDPNRVFNRSEHVWFSFYRLFSGTIYTSLLET